MLWRSQQRWEAFASASATLSLTSLEPWRGTAGRPRVSAHGRRACRKAGAKRGPRRDGATRLIEAEAEGLTLTLTKVQSATAKSATGFYGVRRKPPGRPRPYEAAVRRGGKNVSLGSFATAEEAALCVARSPEGQAAAKRPAATPPRRR